MAFLRNVTIAGSLWLTLTPGISADVGEKFEQAEKFAWRQNWTKARPLYEQASKEYEAKGEARGTAAAKIGWILSSIYTASSKELLEELEREFRKPVVAQDLESAAQILGGQSLSGRTARSAGGTPSLEPGSGDRASPWKKRVGEPCIRALGNLSMGYRHRQRRRDAAGRSGLGGCLQ